MSHDKITLNDRFDLSKDRVLLNGTQALVRLMLIQKQRDRVAGLNTAGYVTGYRGSPLGNVDLQMGRAKPVLEAADIVFQSGLNEDLAATALWGAQQAELRGEGKFDGVFGLWYGKGPGVDRSGDVMRHANMAGTSAHGGVLMAMGDDHTGESSTTLHQSDWAMVDAYMPVLSPAGVQEILDYGIYGYGLSRFAGVWAGLKLMKDTVEVTSVVDGRPDRMSLVVPQFDMPEGGLNIRLVDDRIPQETRMIDYKRFAAEAYARANKIDKRVWGQPGAKIGFVAAGKNWLDLVHALRLLNIDEAEAQRLGITTYKVGQVWPLDMDSFHDWAEGLDLIVVVEEKRKLVEVQIKEALFDDRRGRRVYGWHKGDSWENGRREELFPTRFCLEPVHVAKMLGRVLIEEGRGTEGIQAGLKAIQEAESADNAPEIASRLPYFCAGCPHNTSTKLPKGSRGYAGIGCHYMVQWMDRETVGYTHMGGEGANWIGEAPFSNRQHIFQNLGDGTYNHSGVQAIRAAIYSGVNMTYKVLYNDAVAMTGGQTNDGGLSPSQIAQEVTAMGAAEVVVVYDDKEDMSGLVLPAGVEKFPRADLMSVQERLTKVPGVSVLIYVQTCAAEKRRRRKRGQFPDPDKRVFINTDICEGCGDCGAQSNCVAIVPVETPLGRKRAIDQSACNKDFSCLKGFCPSFVTVQGGTPRKTRGKTIDVGHLAEPILPEISGTHNVVITGVGGTGVVSIGAILAMAAHVDGKAAGMMEMAGLAQKGGAVHIHCRLANTPEDISAIRVATGEADTLIGGDLVVSAGSKTLALTKPGDTKAVVNTHEIVTGAFTHDTEFTIPGDRLQLSLQARLQDKLVLFDATDLARILMGDTIFSNQMLLGAAWQLGQLPVSHGALQEAIRLNGAAVERNLEAFEYGRWAALNPDQAAALGQDNVTAMPATTAEVIDLRARHLRSYQSPLLARKYRKLVAGIAEGPVQRAVAENAHRLMAYKDEYEVARLLRRTRAQAKGAFEGKLKLTYHLAPPMLSQQGADGRPAKREYGPKMIALLGVMARFKFLRGTPFDPFGYTAERRMERRLRATYFKDIALLRSNKISQPDLALALAEWPGKIRGFGPVKAANAQKALALREDILAQINAAPEPQKHAAE